MTTTKQINKAGHSSDCWLDLYMKYKSTCMTSILAGFIQSLWLPMHHLNEFPYLKLQILNYFVGSGITATVKLTSFIPSSSHGKVKSLMSFLQCIFTVRL